MINYEEINYEEIKRLYRVAVKLDRMAEREKEMNLYGDRREAFDEKAFDEKPSAVNIVRTNNPAILEAFLKANKENQRKREDFNKRDYSETHIPGIEKVIFNEPATIVFWNDGTKTVVKCCEKDSYDREVGFKTALLTKMFSKQALRDMINTYVPKKTKEVCE